ncbi:MAG: hypothetical protein KDC85_12275 [Saprospiraceae bacterium]|nr:hypothetical protein [Saprospiraceae bacterium]MCB9324448.1 hypothetical protein [Lewinellaceae bacterium]
MKSVSATLFVCLIIFLQSCNQQENPITQPSVFEDYFVRYLAPEQKLKAQAIFSLGDSIDVAVPFVPFGGVAFMGSGMEMKKISEQLIRYSSESSAEYQNIFKFRHKNPAGDIVPYEISMTPIEDFFVKSKASKSSGLDLVIKGGLLSPQESLVFLFSDQNNVAASYTLSGPTKNIEFHLPPNSIKNLSPGNGKLYIVKKIMKQESLDHREIHAEVEYYTKDIDIEIND